jgi:hypothetical protein
MSNKYYIDSAHTVSGSCVIGCVFFVAVVKNLIVLWVRQCIGNTKQAA